MGQAKIVVSEYSEILDALEFAGGAIEDACLTEDGLNSDTGMSVLDMIHEQLLKHNSEI